jgi:hypothetical protein
VWVVGLLRVVCRDGVGRLAGGDDEGVVRLFFLVDAVDIPGVAGWLV